MGAPIFTRRTVEDAARDLALAADRLRLARAEADRTVAELEARWAANRMTIDQSGERRRAYACAVRK